MSFQPGDFALLMYTVAFALSIMVGGATTYAMFIKDPAKTVDVLKAFYDGGNGLRIVTVLTVLATAAVLGFSDRLKPEVVSLLSGIAGFVLGGMNAPRKQITRDQTPEAKRV